MTDIVERTKANPIQAAEDVLADIRAMTPDAYIQRLWTALAELLTHARTLEADLKRLRGPLGHGAELVAALLSTRECTVCEGDGLKMNMKPCNGCGSTGRVMVYGRLGEESAAFIIRQSTEIAELRAAQDIKLDAEYRNGLNQAARIISQYEMENKTIDGIKHVAAISARLTDRIIEARKERKALANLATARAALTAFVSR